ncbi:bifunctional glutamine-synthetase adenylyltransferase/deadenyltransferase [Parenemella sanctibonifatiensis]|uniref:Bifunctional glutamine-synthetase adenylyltransferase/deadenyltransferase n=1 Tax=Parenemella sanctibonifatiensis TaxID=2016505 RepID=A0A255EDJ0_9ACTN|nr:bifunctional [glutamine synthetase] adenylyltransferase/[glutamine synthetase]-adenylyl-L-tyrosine phosphorylase [Parenemella sanctibonifatiensis]OYN89599.1 bifunctional glutamine-synthetase adenylyltransferase/deadenyltransferase [Parenemella sanctibonifatiensis]
MTRTPSTMAVLAQLGFDDVERMRAVVEPWPEEYWPMLYSAAASADPDQCLMLLADLVDAAPERVDQLLDHDRLRRNVTVVLGASDQLGKHLVQHPEQFDDLEEVPARATSWGLPELAGSGDSPQWAGDEVRRAYRDALTRIACRDLTETDPTAIVEDITAEISDLTDEVLQAGMVIARRTVGADADNVRLGVVALGKAGARELNYISDVDVLYVVAPADGASEDDATRIGTKLVGALARFCSSRTPAGTFWTLDAGLRPEGNAGPLVRTLASHQKYYERWAQNWEFQAMLKARPVAGDLELAQDFIDMIDPMVWRVSQEKGFIGESRAMRKRVVDLIPKGQADREIKLGVGGLRDVEFSVQLLQLVHGSADERLRLRGTWEALRALSRHAYIGRRDAEELAEAYDFERVLEHRVQLRRLRRTHLFPDDEAGLAHLARSTGEIVGNDSGVLVRRWKAAKGLVGRLQQRLFYSPVLEAVARLGARDRLSEAAAQDRLEFLGYLDPKAAMAHLQALTSGTSRSVEIQRQLLPAMLEWFANGANPDLGLLSFRQLSEKLGSSPWYLRALRDEGGMAEHLALVLSTSRYSVNLLQREPSGVQMLTRTSRLDPRSREEMTASMVAAASRREEPKKAMEAIRAQRRTELLRVSLADVLGRTDIDQEGRALSDIAHATIAAALTVASRGVDNAPSLGVIALGRWGGGEMAYGSDVDAMFVMGEGDAQAAGQVIANLRSMLRAPGPDPALVVDTDLRPEGRGGADVRTLSAYRSYYERWSSTWERQAMVRAAAGPGNEDLVADLMAIIDEHRWARPLTTKQVIEVRRLKARMEQERLPRGHDPKANLKLGPGGLSDVEWTVQLLQLQHAHEVRPLRTPNTMAALAAAKDADLVSAEDARILREAWQLASQVRNSVVLVRGRSTDTLPGDRRELAACAELLGYGPSQASHLLDDLAAAMRRSRRVAERLFWGEDPTQGPPAR